MSDECLRCGQDVWDDCTNCAKDAEIDRLRAELTDVRAVLAAVDELGRGMSIGLGRTAEERDAALAAIARVRELCDETDGPPTVRKDVIHAAIEGNQP